MQTDKQEILSSESTESVKSAGSADPVNSAPEKKRKNKILSLVSNFWSAIVDRQIIYKVITLLFALLVFGFVYLHMEGHRSILTYMGLMLLMVLVYVEILIIRDHLWVIEGSMREARKWRDIFFNQSTLRRQRIRKVFSVLFALGIFSYVYMKVPKANTPVLSFMGIILMITMLYYEILTIRDDVFLMRQALTQHILEGQEDVARKAEYDRFLVESASEKSGSAESSGEVPQQNTDNSAPESDATPKQ